MLPVECSNISAVMSKNVSWYVFNYFEVKSVGISLPEKLH